MPEDRLLSISSTGRLSPEELARRTFPTVRRGFDPAHVRALLEEVARELQAVAERERELRRELTDAQHRAANPVLDEATLASALGQETARVLRSAHEAANEVLTKSEADATRLVAEAQEEAEQLQQRVESIAAERSTQAELAASETRRRAQEEATSVLEMARLESEAGLGQTRSECREMVSEAQDLRTRVLTDLSRRRRVLHAQIEQLRAGREHLAETVRDVRRNIDRIADDLFRAEDDARLAAELAGKQALADASAAQPDAHEMEALAIDSPRGLEAGPLEAGSFDDTSMIGLDGPGPAFRLVPRPQSESEGSADATLAGSSEGAPVASSVHASTLDRPAGPTAPLGASPSVVPAQVPEPVPDGEGGEGDERRPVVEVEELFARIRASRDAGSDETQSELAAVAVEAGSDVRGLATQEGDVPETLQEDGAEGSSDSSDPGVGPVGPDGALLRKRDELLRPAVIDLARRLKRTLQDDQNDLLDRLRSHGGTWSDALLISLDDHEERFVAAGLPHLQEAGRAAWSFTGAEPGSIPEVQGTAAELAAAVVVPLRRRLSGVADRLAGADEAAVIEHIGAAYREWKGQRIERLAGDYAVAAFSQAALGILGKGSPVRWIVDDGGAPCPDCDDNALSGTQPLGEKFPTGHDHPPAHPGCRCLLVAADRAGA